MLGSFFSRNFLGVFPIRFFSRGFLVAVSQGFDLVLAGSPVTVVFAEAGFELCIHTATALLIDEWIDVFFFFSERDAFVHVPLSFSFHPTRSNDSIEGTCAIVQPCRSNPRGDDDGIGTHVRPGSLFSLLAYVWDDVLHPSTEEFLLHVGQEAADGHSGSTVELLWHRCVDSVLPACSISSLRCWWNRSEPKAFHRWIP